MYLYEFDAIFLKLLEDSPITSPTIADHIRDAVKAGEYGHAFSLLSGWIYDDELPISRDYHRRLVEMSEELGKESESTVSELHKHIVE